MRQDLERRGRCEDDAVLALGRSRLRAEIVWLWGRWWCDLQTL